MALNVTLGKLIEQVQLEAGFSAAPNMGQNFRATIAHHIRKAQQFFLLDYDWPHLRGTTDNEAFVKMTQAGERYYDFPDQLDPASIRQVWYKWGGVWTPVYRGIDPTDYTSLDSDLGVTSDPVLKWEERVDGQFEVWPMPASDDMQILFEGNRLIGEMISESDTAVLDDIILVPYAASKALEKRDPKEAALKMATAMRIYYKLRHRKNAGIKSNMAEGIGDTKIDPRDPTQRIIAVSSGGN